MPPLIPCRAASVYGSPQYEEMRAKCIGQELSWEVPAAKWESVLRDVQAGRKPQVQSPLNRKGGFSINNEILILTLSVLCVLVRLVVSRVSSPGNVVELQLAF